MLKLILAEQLKPGMHVHAFCGSWMSHPFWRDSFKLKNQDEIKAILDSGIKELWIDSEKGLDVEVHNLKAGASLATQQPLATAAGPAPNVNAPVSLAQEIRRAAKICDRSRQAVESMFEEARMGKSIDSKGAQHLVEEISDSMQRNPGALISIARLKTADNYTYMHSVAVCGLMIALARELRLDVTQTRDAGLAGLLHDVGKMAIPPEILNKPDKLSSAEFTLVRDHPVQGHRMLLEGKDIAEVALDVCLHHHEKFDGTGYPQRLSGDRISLYAKMGAVCDAYDAITSNRPYKKAWEPAESIHRMAKWCGGHFELKVFQAFVKCVGIYPIGTLVKLQSGRLGVVIDQSGQSLLTPKVKVFFSIKSQIRLPPEIVDLAFPGCAEKIASHEDPKSWNFSGLEDLWRGAESSPP